MNTTTIQIRIDEKTKEQAKKIYCKYGLDLSSAIKMFLRKTVISNFPSGILTLNGFTSEYEEKVLRESKRALRYAKRHKNFKEAYKHIVSNT